MTVSSEVRKAGPYTGSGTTVFPFEFTLQAPGHVMLVHTDSEGVETVLTLDSDYTVSLNGDQDVSPGGSVTYPVSGDPLPADEKLTITSNAPNLQALDLTNLGGFYPATINRALDRATIQIQQIAEQAGRSVKVPISDERTPEEFWADLLVEVNTSEANAEAAAASALDSKNAAQAALTTIKNAYYGALSADPTLRPDGTAMQVGDRYYNTTDGVEKTFNGTSWYVPNVDGQVLGQEFHEFVDGVIDTLDMHLIDPEYVGPLGDDFVEQALDDGFQAAFE